jgi:hypothetical protein
MKYTLKLALVASIFALAVTGTPLKAYAAVSAYLHIGHVTESATQKTPTSSTEEISGLLNAVVSGLQP